MKIQKLISPSNVYIGIDAPDMESGLAAIAERMAPGLGLEPKGVVDALLERERLGSTSVGDGFAIPHCKIHGIRDIAIGLARFSQPVTFGAESGVSVVFVILSPLDQPAPHLQVLSQVARVLKRRELRAELMAAEDPDDVMTAIQRAAQAEGL